MIIFMIASLVLMVAMVFEGQIGLLWGMVFKSAKKEMIEAPDLYEDIDFEQLCKEFKLQKVERQKFEKLREKFQSSEIRDFIDPYLELVKRNE